MTTWSFQIYSARNFQPWADIYKTIAELGYRQVEGFGPVYTDAVATRAALDANGLTMPTAHFGIDPLENDVAGTLSIAKTLGIETIYCPYLMPADRPTDATGWKAHGARLEKAGRPYRDAGLKIGWHNHDFEFTQLSDGSVPMSHILEGGPNLEWEIDVAWVIRGKDDPLVWIDKYGPRITAAHVKDIAPVGENRDEDGWADVGQGIVNWRVILKALKEKTKVRHFVLEHDNPSDFKRFASRSIAALNNMEG